ncbi:MAG: hypothetical protein ACPLW7_06960, partial [Minisyncoccia bacterium]
MKKEKKFLLSLILLILILFINQPILFSKNVKDPPPSPTPPETKGELNINISQNDLEILVGDKKTIDVNLVAKDGNIPNFNLTLELKSKPIYEIKDFSWIEIECDNKFYKVNEKIYFNELKKNESKILKIIFNPIIFNPDDKTILGEYHFEFKSSYEKTKFSPSNLIKVLIMEKGTLKI